jgi:flagellar basal body rod protein FlgG
MNVGLYSGAAGMRVGQDYQQLITENLSLQSVPGYKQTLPVFSTDAQVTTGKAQTTGSGNPAAVRMTRVVDFTQGPVQPSGDPYHLAIEGKGFFEVREANGSTSYTRNGSFTLSPKGQLHTSDGSTVLGKGGTPITVDTTKAGNVSIGADGTISINGAQQGKLAFAHFDNPSASLQPGAYGRFVSQNSSDAKAGLAPNDHVLQGSLEQSNGNPVQQMADMIQAVRLYEANQKSIQAVDDTQNQLITNLGAHPQG